MSFDCCQQIQMLYNKLGLSNETNENINKTNIEKSINDEVVDDIVDDISSKYLEKESQKKLYCSLLNNYLIHKSGLSKYAPEINLKNQKLNHKTIESIVDFTDNKDFKDFKAW
jgi:hypothetical protein